MATEPQGGFTLGLHLAWYGTPDDPPRDLFKRVAACASAAEEAGFDALFVPDHLWQLDPLGGPSAPMFESSGVLAALACTTSTLQLGALVSAVTFRNPALLAKSVATLDVISGGRAILGLGAAWHPDEHVAFGMHFPPPGERLERLEEAARICRSMLADDAPSFDGRHYSVSNIWNVPRPVRDHLPILIGGGGEQRTLRIVAELADIWNFAGGSELELLRHKMSVLDKHCESIGRDPATVQRTCCLNRPPRTEDELCAVTVETMRAGIEGVVMVAPTLDPSDVAMWGRAMRRGAMDAGRMR